MEFDKYLQELNQLIEEHRNFEVQMTGKRWSDEQLVLAYLTDAGAIGREIVASQGVIVDETYDQQTFGTKLAQNIYWLAMIAKTKGFDLEKELQKFLKDSTD